MEGLILDLILVAVVLLFAWLGGRRGLILSFCSLVAVVVGLIGGSLLADWLTPPLTAQIAPMVEGFLQEKLTSGALALTGGDGFLGRIAGELYASRDWVLSATTFTYELALALTRAVLRPILFLIAFVVVLILWYFLSHALDLVAHLPLLSTLNAAGGFLFGAVKGGLLLMVAALLIRHFKPDLIPDAALEASRVLKLLQKAPPLF